MISTFADLAQLVEKGGINKIIRSNSTPERTLHIFACDCAERILQKRQEKGQKIDFRLWKAIKYKRRWLAKEISDKKLESVRSGIQDVWDPSWVIPWNALRAFGKDAAFSISSIAAQDANWSEEEWEWQRNRLTELINQQSQFIQQWQQDGEEKLFE